MCAGFKRDSLEGTDMATSVRATYDEGNSCERSSSERANVTLKIVMGYMRICIYMRKHG